jgi:DNA primase
MKEKMEKNWVDFKLIKGSVSIRDVLDHYGILAQFTERKGELTGKCPFHSETRPSLHVSLAKNVWHCFGCGRKGGVLEFVMEMEKVSLKEAGLKLVEWFGLDEKEVQPEKKERAAATEPTSGPAAGKKGATLAPEAQTENPPLKFALKVDPGHPYLKERGLKEETIQKFGLGLASKGMMAGRIAIPVHNERGELVAYAGRFIGKGEPPEEEAKYRFPPAFKKSLVVYNLHRIPRESSWLVLVEGFFATFWLSQNGFRNTAALMGAAMSAEQEELLVRWLMPWGRVFVWLDGDEAGERGSSEIALRLDKRRFVKEIRLPGQPEDYDEEKLKEIFRIGEGEKK